MYIIDATHTHTAPKTLILLGTKHDKSKNYNM